MVDGSAWGCGRGAPVTRRVRPRPSPDPADRHRFAQHDVSIILVCPSAMRSHFTSSTGRLELEAAAADEGLDAAAVPAPAALPLAGFRTTSFVGYSPRSQPHEYTSPSSVRQQQLMSRTERETMRRSEDGRRKAARREQRSVRTVSYEGLCSTMAVHAHPRE